MRRRRERRTVYLRVLARVRARVYWVAGHSTHAALLQLHESRLAHILIQSTVGRASHVKHRGMHAKPRYLLLMLGKRVRRCRRRCRRR